MMPQKRIIIKDEIKTPLAVTSDKAQYIYHLLSNAVKNQEKVIVDFSNITTLTTAFLNTAIGQLYAIDNSENLNKFITIDSSTLNELQKQKVRLVMDNAKSQLSKSEINEEMYNGNQD